jgi:hypothetical protein
MRTTALGPSNSRRTNIGPRRCSVSRTGGSVHPPWSWSGTTRGHRRSVHAVHVNARRLVDDAFRPVGCRPARHGRTMPARHPRPTARSSYAPYSLDWTESTSRPALPRAVSREATCNHLHTPARRNGNLAATIAVSAFQGSDGYWQRNVIVILLPVPPKHDLGSCCC